MVCFSAAASSVPIRIESGIQHMSKKARDGISTSPQITLGDHEYFQHRVLLNTAHRLRAVSFGPPTEGEPTNSGDATRWKVVRSLLKRWLERCAC